MGYRSSDVMSESAILAEGIKTKIFALFQKQKKGWLLIKKLKKK